MEQIKTFLNVKNRHQLLTKVKNITNLFNDIQFRIELVQGKLGQLKIYKDQLHEKSETLNFSIQNRIKVMQEETENINKEKYKISKN